MRVVIEKVGRVLLIAVVLVGLVPPACRAEALAPDVLYQQALPSVVRLEVETEGGRTVVGNAFMAVKDGAAVTACHLLRGAQRATAIFPNGEAFDVSGLIDRDEARNVALIRVKVAERPLLALNTAEPPVGSTVYVIGPPEGLEFGFADGMLSQAQTVDTVRTYQFTSSSPLSRSGGPLLDSSGAVLGVVAIRLQDGLKLNFAIPATYVAGLDSTLPTQPWREVRWEGTSETPQANAAQDGVDSKLVEALVGAFDLVAAYVYADNVTGGKGYKQGVPQMLYTYRQQAESQLRAISTLKSDDLPRQRLLQETAQLLGDCLKAADLFANAVVIAQGSTWGPKSKDLWGRSQAIIGAVSSNRTGLYAAAQEMCNVSPEFCQQLPNELQYYLELRPREAGFALGVTTFVRDPFNFLVVHSSSMAEKLGFRLGDRLLAVGDRAFQPTDSIEELKLLLKENVGEKVNITVVRQGEEKTITAKVPE